MPSAILAYWVSHVLSYIPLKYHPYWWAGGTVSAVPYWWNASPPTLDCTNKIVSFIALNFRSMIGCIEDGSSWLSSLLLLFHQFKDCVVLKKSTLLFVQIEIDEIELSPFIELSLRVFGFSSQNIGSIRRKQTTQHVSTSFIRMGNKGSQRRRGWIWKQTGYCWPKLQQQYCQPSRYKHREELPLQGCSKVSRIFRV